MMIAAAFCLLLQAPTKPRDLVGDALSYLVRHQAENGAWGRRPPSCTCPEDPAFVPDEVEATSLAVLAFLGAGFRPPTRKAADERGYGAAVEKGLLWMIGRQQPDGSYKGGSPAAEALAALAMSEALGLISGPLYRGPAQKALDYLVAHPATDARGLFYQGMALKSAQLSELLTPKGADVQVTEALSARRGEEPWSLFVLSSIQILKIFTYRHKRFVDLSGLPGVDPSRMEMETVYAVSLALFQADGPEGPTWQGWARSLKAWSVPAQNAAAESCARGSWGGGDTGRRVKTAAFGALSHEYYYATANVWPK